jgi:hypothetical protein
MVMKRGMRLAAAGLFIGLAGAGVMTRFNAALSFPIQPNDGLTFMGNSCTLAGMAVWLAGCRLDVLLWSIPRSP